MLEQVNSPTKKNTQGNYRYLKIKGIPLGM